MVVGNSLIEALLEVLPVLDNDAIVDNRWAGDGSDEVIAAEMVLLAKIMDRAKRALLKRSAALVRSSGPLSPTGVLLEAGWSHPMCARHRQLAVALYGSAGRTATAAALDADAMRVEHAQVIVEALRKTPAAQKDGVEEVLIDAATRADPMILGRAAGYAVRLAAEAAHPGEIDDAAAEARGLFIAPLLDGLVDVRGTLTSAAGEALLAAVTPLAVPQGPDDARRPAQRRHDALEELALRALVAGDLPDHGGQRPHVVVHADGRALVAPRDAAGAQDSQHALARSRWVGATSVTDARTISCDAVLTRIVLDRDAPESLAPAIAYTLPPALGGAPSEILDVGRATRAVSPALRRALVARDRGCAQHGCSRSAAYCDAHHIRHWSDGGATSLENLRLLCRRHHRAQHRHDEHGRAELSRARWVNSGRSPSRSPVPAASRRFGRC